MVQFAENKVDTKTAEKWVRCWAWLTPHSYFVRMKDLGVRKGILVAFNDIASLARQVCVPPFLFCTRCSWACAFRHVLMAKIIERMRGSNYHLQMFDQGELIVNITKHQAGCISQSLIFAAGSAARCPQR